ncbi:YtpI family protein [Chengkuizengella sp. SCS-71B]|uniref:YtpI family protein n=1 Tax=Chengkuizengella sp. SCS-71B TaxID=3115290 RepID=UPI0032C22D45
MDFLNLIPLIIVLVAAWLSFYFSMKARRTKDAKQQGLMRSRMNMSIGVGLITIACIQLFLFEFTWTRFIVGIIFLLLGIANIYGGIRNHVQIMKFMNQ